MKKQKTALTVLLLFTINLVKAQSYGGYLSSSYAGVYNTVYNPAGILDLRFRADINLVGFSIAANNNVVKIDAGNKDGVPLPEYVKKNGRAGIYTDVMGPAVLIRLSEKHAFAITSRARVMANVDAVDKALLNVLFPQNAPDSALFNLKHTSIQAQAWNEIGLSYSRRITNSANGVWKLGATVKRTSGQGGAYINAGDLSARFLDSVRSDAATRTVYSGLTDVQGSLSWNYASFMNGWFDTYKFKFWQQPGFAADLGIVYENRGVSQADGPAYNDETLNYKWKAGLGITDIGSIRYRSGSGRAIRFGDQSYELSQLEAKGDSLKDFSDFYAGKFGGIQAPASFTMALPATAHLSFDYSFNQWLSAGAIASIPLRFTRSPYFTGTHTLPVVTVTPRAELTWCGLYLPVTYNGLSGLGIGAALRLGPLVVGTSNGLPFLFTRKAKGADGYFMLRIPLFRYKPFEFEDVIPGKKGKGIKCPKIVE